MARANKSEIQPEEITTEEIVTGGNSEEETTADQPIDPNVEKTDGENSENPEEQTTDTGNPTEDSDETKSDEAKKSDDEIAAEEYLAREAEAAKLREETERKAMEAIPAVTNIEIEL